MGRIEGSHPSFEISVVYSFTIGRSEVWCVRVLEFVLERDAFYLPFVFATTSYEKPVFHS